VQAQAAAKEAKASAAKERLSAEKAQNCQRARNQLQMLQSGVRMARANDKGEREFLDDKARADEIARTQQLISANCE
jgi:two-component sensor histidine kinase